MDPVQLRLEVFRELVQGGYMHELDADALVKSTLRISRAIESGNDSAPEKGEGNVDND